MIEEGCRELWLTSEDLGAWGRDIGHTIPDLLNALVEIIPEGCMASCILLYKHLRFLLYCNLLGTIFWHSLGIQFHPARKLRIGFLNLDPFR